MINTDGSVTGTYKIEQVGSIYTLTGNISGNIHVERSNIVINGSGYWLDGNGATGITLNDLNGYPTITVTNVTVENLHIINYSNGIFSNGGTNNTFYDDAFSNCSCQGSFAIELMGCNYNNISYCAFDNTSEISMDYSADYNTVTECNFPYQNAILVWLSGYETVDRNYWGDYLARYPNASEIDHSGVGNTPYVFNMPNSGTQVFEDTQPLMNPVIIPLMGSSTTQTNVPEFSSLLMAIPLILLLFAVAVIVRRRKALT